MRRVPVFEDLQDNRSFPQPRPDQKRSAMASLLVSFGDGERGIPPCQSCHGPVAYKIGVPSLANQNADYVLRPARSVRKWESFQRHQHAYEDYIDSSQRRRKTRTGRILRVRSWALIREAPDRIRKNRPMGELPKRVMLLGHAKGNTWCQPSRAVFACHQDDYLPPCKL